MEIHLRDASRADSDFVFNVRSAAFGPYIELAGGRDELRERQQHDERWRRHRFRVIVADGSDAGYVSTGVYDQSAGMHPAGLYVHQMMILPGYQSRGIGSVVFRAIRAEASDLGLPLRLRVLRVNPRGLAFYLAAGCEVVNESASHVSLQWLP